VILILIVILTSNSLGSILIRETINNDYYEPYVSAQYPYSTYVTHSQYFVTISISGLPSEYSAIVKINGNDAGTVKGGSSKEFEVESTKSNVFQIENQISGKEDVRYICQESTWTLDQAQEPYTPYAYYHYPYYSHYYPPYYDGTTTTTTTTTTDTTTTTTTTTTSGTTTSGTTTSGTTTSGTTTSGTTTSGTTTTDTTTTTTTTTTSGTTTTDTTGITTTETTTTGATTSSSTQPTTTTTSASPTTTSTTTRRTTTSGTTSTETQSSQQETESAHDSKEYKLITNAAAILQIAYPTSSSNKITEKYQQVGYYQDSTAYAGSYYFDDYLYNQYYPSPYYYPYYNYYPYYDYSYNYGYPRSSTLEASHTFTYEPEYMLTIQNPHGASIEKSGWKQKDTTVTLTTPEKIEESNTERYVFKAWYIDGSENAGSTITLTMNKQYDARAEYETQYYLEVRSELGRPQGSGWYNEGYSAIITVDPEVPMLGFWGSLGAKYVFDRWSGISSGDMFSATTKVVVENPMTINAIWRADYSYAYMILAIILVAALLLIAFTIIALTRGINFRREHGSQPLDTLNLRYSQGEISRTDYLKMKKDLEKS